MAKLTNTTIYGSANITGSFVMTGNTFDISANGGINISSANSISSVIITNTGAGYQSIPSVVFSNTTTGGVTANANAVIRISGTVGTGTGFTSNVGAGYANGDILYANNANSLANAWFVVTDNTATTWGTGGIKAISVGNYGLFFALPNFYNSSGTLNTGAPYYLQITGNTSVSGTGANIQFSASGFTVNNVYFSNYGSGYVEQPTVTFTGGSPTTTATGYVVIGSSANVRFLGNGVNIFSSNTTFSGNVSVANTTASTSNTTGAVTISGGLGVAGNVYANGIYTSGLFYAANGNPISTGGGGTSLAYTAATTPPASGNNKGDQWYNTTTNVMYEWATDGTNYFWIDTSSPTVSNTSNIAINITGNINVGIVFANTVVANVNSTIIYSNTISVLGNVNANIIFANTITANYIGNGSQITGISASQISGLYANTNLSNYLSSTNISTSAITNTGNLTTGNLTVTGSANFVTNSNSSLSMTINNLLETVNLQTTVGQTLVNYYVAQQSIMLNTTPATANMTLNITGHPSGAKLNTLLGVGQSITVAYGFTNGATTGYYINQLQIDGTNITPRYLGGNSQTGGDPSAVDMYTWTIIKTASTPTYNVFASNTKYA